MILNGTFPNAEGDVIAWLRAWLERLAMPVPIWSELPEGWEDDDQMMPLPAILVERIPGGGSGSGEPFEGSAYLDITVWTRERGELWPIVQQVEVAMVGLPGRGASMYDTVNHPQLFGEVPYNNRQIRRAVGSYELMSRAQ
jgi:hypothetical protein